jgi:hypothetical protein
MLSGWLALGVTLVHGRAGAETMKKEEPPPRHRLFYQNLFALRYNPLGAFEELRLSYRYRLMDSESILLRDTFAGVGIVPGLSPAFGRLGFFAELQPLTMLALTAQYDLIRYFGAFKVMQSFPDARSEFSDTELEHLSDAKRTYVTTGRQLTLGALLQAKVGNVVFRSNFRFAYVDMELRAGDTVYYDILYDILAPGRGWLLVNDTDLLYQTSFGLTAGVRYSAGHAFYEDSELPPGAENRNAPIQRVGPFLAYTFFRKEGNARFNNPTVVLLVQWWLSHRYRTGADVSQGVPLLGIAFLFNGELWGSR